MKYRQALLLVLLVLIVDQASKIYIKTHFYMGEEVDVIGKWFRLHFLENEGMAFGMKFSQTEAGKIILSLFRLVAVVVGFFLLRKLTRGPYTKGLIICGALILAGAMGNLIDSLFYGLIFTESTFQIAQFVTPGHGYAGFLHGRVVDMLYFPIASIHIPEGFPLLGGKQFEFFEPVFNIADASITIGVFVLIFFQKKLMPHRHPARPTKAAEPVKMEGYEQPTRSTDTH